MYKDTAYHRHPKERCQDLHVSRPQIDTPHAHVTSLKPLKPCSKLVLVCGKVSGNAITSRTLDLNKPYTETLNSGRGRRASTYCLMLRLMGINLSVIPNLGSTSKIQPRGGAFNMPACTRTALDTNADIAFSNLWRNRDDCIP